MFRNITLPLQFQGENVKEGDTFLQRKTGIKYTMKWMESSLAFKLVDEDGRICGNPRVNLEQRADLWSKI